jgi:hypothetical protein
VNCPGSLRGPRKAAERAFALDEAGDETFPFILARDLGMTVAALDATMDHGEYVQWRAFYVWERAMAEFKASLRRG